MHSEDKQNHPEESGVETAPPSPQTEAKPPGDGPARRSHPLRKILRIPWLRWTALFTGALILAAWFGFTRPAVHSRLSTLLGSGSAAEASAASPSEETTQPLPQIPRPGPETFISRGIVSHSDETAGGRLDVTTYTVQAGDFLFGIAEQFDLQPETILWSNYSVLKDNPDFLKPGQMLFILPVDGLYYQWQAGDRLDKVAESFGVTPEDIILWPGNYLDPAINIQNPDIPPGTWLVVQDGHREFTQWEIPVIRRTDNTPWVAGGEGACQGPFSGPAGTGMWTWPTASHWVCGNEYTAYHHGIDLYITMDEPIRAADRGVVVYAGWNTWGYGNLVVVDHGNDWQTVYAHLDQVNVYCGATVNRGESIGLGGTTGNSTGPHLHFEMIFSGLRVNPHDYLF
jgi:murein DD-endopeptidase MepM/ murein hydrolase activator NlpD